MINSKQELTTRALAGAEIESQFQFCILLNGMHPEISGYRSTYNHSAFN